MASVDEASLDFRAIFEAVPGLYLVLEPDLTIVGASDAYLRATMTDRAILGRTMFDVFPDNDPAAAGEGNVRASLARVLSERRADAMAVQKYDVRRPPAEGGGFEERYWSPLNAPVLAADGSVRYILHRVEDVTEFVRSRAQHSRTTEENEELKARAGRMDVEIFQRAHELQEANVRLRELQEKLEERVEKRTNALIESRRMVAEHERRSDAQYQAFFESTPIPMLLADLETLSFITVNEAAIRFYGYSRDEFGNILAADLHHPDEREAFLQAIAEGRPPAVVRRHLRKDGTVMYVEARTNDLEFEGRKARLVAIYDITERRKAEEDLRLKDEQLQQARKMDAVGRLAGGVAHDFNNMLSVILSYCVSLEADLPPENPIRSDIEEIHAAGVRAAELTRQLLTFSRQNVVEPQVLDLNDVVSKMDKMLRRVLGEDIDLSTVQAGGLGCVRADEGQIEQVILNLAINARDAMPGGGKLSLETANVAFDDEGMPGRFVLLTVTDTGVGMDEATLARVFEPFFTTKGVGKGTGLGLATVFGIVEQSGGRVRVASEPGRGTTFRIYLPEVDGGTPSRRAPFVPKTLRGTETILLVEDNDQVRAVARGILRRSGYTVIEARNAGEAILHCENDLEGFQILLTDVVMPQMGGPELAKRLRRQRPDLKVLCMSGYAEDSVLRQGVLEAGLAYLQKPFTPESLTRKIREVLDAPAPSTK